MSVPLLEVRQIRKGYQLQGRPPLEILHGVDFSLGAGECRPLCGPSGAGKSTLLHILGGLGNSDAGVTYWKVQNINGHQRYAWTQWRRG